MAESPVSTGESVSSAGASPTAYQSEPDLSFE